MCIVGSAGAGNHLVALHQALKVIDFFPDLYEHHKPEG